MSKERKRVNMAKSIGQRRPPINNPRADKRGTLAKRPAFLTVSGKGKRK